MINIKKIPSTPGCYLFKDADNKILYIGKAADLRKRVASYIQRSSSDQKTVALMQHVVSVDFIVTNTELEAFILENTLIKKHQPRYNINLKDAKTYAYIHITNEEYPRLLVARQKANEGKYFGPFVSAQERDYILAVLQKIFHLRTCKKLPKKVCLRYHINLCDAPCIQQISRDAYSQKIQHVKMILSGKITELIESLTKEMHQYAADQNFEQALQIRKQLEALRHLHQRQYVQRTVTYNEDVIHYQLKNGTVYLMMFNVDKGTLVNKQEYIFPETTDFFEEFLIQYYSENPIPSRVIVPVKLSATLHHFLETQKKKKVHIISPKKGAKKQLLDLVYKNIEFTFFGDSLKIEELKRQLNLPETPTVIECFDISHLQGTLMVGSMVQYRNGKPDKQNYRRFRIRTVDGVNDVAAIAEVINRRYHRLQQNMQEYPNLIIIDGGRGQLSSAYAELQKLEINIPIIALAKQYEEIYFPGKQQPIRLDKKDKALHFIQEIRDEAHRFALSYNRLLRKKKLKA
ncbi:MAG: excinuclease ABC subunit UvrC [Candidatus Thermoplasmatota archaeon]